MRLKIVFILLSFIPVGWADTTGSGKIKTLMNAYGGWILSVDSSNSNPLNCTKPTLFLESTHPQYKELYGYILSAYTSGNPVVAYTNECHANGYSVLTGVWSSWGG